MPIRRKRMRKTLSTGASASERAEMILRSDLTRPKRRMTRRARKMRTMPVGWLVTMSDMTDMATMKVSSRLQAFWMKGWNQWENMLIASSTVKRSVKKRLSLSRMSESSVGEPSGLTRLFINCASVIVQPKF